jgi:hypothetical protein
VNNPLMDIGAEIDQEVAERKRKGVPAPTAPAPKKPAPAGAPLPEGYNAQGGLNEEFGSFVRGGLDMITFGTLDEIGGGLSTVFGGALPGQQSYWTGDKSFSDALASNIAAERAVQKADNENYFKSRLAGQVTGAIVVPMGAGARGAVQLAKVGATQGGLYGLGSGEGLGGRLVEGVKGATIGGVVGGVVGKAIDKFSPGIASFFGKSAKGGGAVDNVADDVASVLTPEGPILGVTRDGAPIIGGLNRAADGNADETLAQALIVRGSQKGTDEAAEGAGTNLARGADDAAEGAAKGPKTPRESVKALQGVVKDLTSKQKAIGDEAVDITWSTSPDVARRTGEWRIGSLEAPEDAQSLLRAIVEGTTSKVRKSDVELERDAYEAASRIGEDPEAVLAYARQIAGSVGDVDTAVSSLRTLWAKVSEDVSDFHLMNVDWSTASDDLVDEAAQRIYNLSAISNEFQKVKTGLGRGLRSIQLPTAKAYLEGVKKAGVEGLAEAEAPRTMEALPRTREQIDGWMQLWGMTGGDPKKQSGMLQDLLTLPTGPKYLRSSFANFFTASILSMPKTVALNIIGPGTISVVRNVERLSGAAAASINPLLSAADRASARQVARHSATAYIQTFTEIGDAFRMALNAAEQNHTIIGGGGQSMDALATYGPFTDNLLNAAGVKPSMSYTLGNLINVWPKAFARLNNGLDEFSKRLAYQGEVRVNAMVEAGDQGLTGAAFAKYVDDAMKASYDDVGHAMDSAMLRSAERTTLTSQVGEKGTGLRAFGNTIQRLRQAVPETRYILPVFNVPVNALAETLRRLPIAAIPGVNKVMFATTAKELAGELGPVAQADAHGRMMLGGAFLMAGVMMNKAGTLTGAGPQDPVDRKNWLMSHQPYSIKVGDQWVNYGKLDILGGLLSIPATINDATIYQDETQDPSEIFFAGMGALAQWFKDRAALRNATSLLALGDDPTKEAGNVFTKVTGTISSGFYPAFLRGITDGVTDPYQPMKRSWGDYMASVLPGNNVELQRNVMGEPIDKPINTIAEVFIPVSTVKAVGWDTDPVLDEIDRLYQATGYSPGADTRSFSRGQFADKDLKLEDGKSLYTHAMKLRQTIKVEGKTLRATLKELFDSPDYNKAVDGRRAGKKTSRGDYNRPYMVGEIFEDFNKAIKKQIANESPMARDYMTAALAKDTDAAYLRDVSVEDLVNNPDLYKTKGVDRAGFEAKLGGKTSTSSLLEAFGYQ